MADYRLKCHSYCNGNMQIEPYYNRPNLCSTPTDFRSQSLSYSSSSLDYNAQAQPAPQSHTEPKPHKLKKAKSSGGCWSVNDPEFQRKRRVASYKVYTVEGKVKGSFRKSFRWIKDRYSQVVYGWW